MRRWYVVHTQTQTEKRALWHLQNQGFECFLPSVRSLRRHARKVEHVLAPLFPRYLFVRLDLDSTPWSAINGTRGVVRLVANGFRPTPVPEGVVEDLQARSDMRPKNGCRCVSNPLACALDINRDSSCATSLTKSTGFVPPNAWFISAVVGIPGGHRTGR